MNSLTACFGVLRFFPMTNEPQRQADLRFGGQGFRLDGDGFLRRAVDFLDAEAKRGPYGGPILPMAAVLMIIFESA